MFRILESQVPAKQNATDTINILSGRLHSATLVEDRRAAILGLRSFAKLFPASVASGALKNLISSLSKDGEDVDTTKVILETLLMLFSPDTSSPESSDDIALWLADEFTQRQENITVLLNLLDRHDFFSRLYSLQLMSAISSARPERTQECVYTAPLGVARLVAVLDDKREAVRTEGLLLLTALTPSSSDLQKLVAFENAFDRAFSIIEAEGSLTHGGVVVQDCLSLLANLLRLNISNQSFFRETGWMAKFTLALKNVTFEQQSNDGVADWAAVQRDKNVWGLLSVIRLFLLDGSIATQVNQVSFWQSGLVMQVLEIAFCVSMEMGIRSEAIVTCADLIRGNGSLQEQFAQLEVSSDSATSQSDGHARIALPPRVNVIQALLDLALSTSSGSAFDLRLSACECIKAYLFRHTPIRLHFLRRVREGYLSDGVDANNILTILLEESHSGDPYRQWIASVLLFHLVYEEYDAKQLAMEIAEGDADKGEEVVTCIQSLTATLISGIQDSDDDRVSIGYLMVLCSWLHEDPDAVNDFLGEGSNVQSLLQIVTQSNQVKGLVAGLCAFLLCIVYEFSTKDSPIPRPTLHKILTAHMGRDQFLDKMTRLREHPIVRDFEVLPRGIDRERGSSFPSVYFDRTFVDFLKDNYSRMLRAIDRDPGIEVSVVTNGVQKGISRELVDSLKAQLEDRVQALQKAESEILTLERKLSQEQADHRKVKETTSAEIVRLRSINASLQTNNEEEQQRIQEIHRLARLNDQRNLENLVEDLRANFQKLKEDTEVAAATVRTRHEAELTDLNSSMQRLDDTLQQANANHLQDLATATEEYSKEKELLESRLVRAEEKAKEAEGRAVVSKQNLDEKEDARASAQAELDDMLMVLGDLEEKRERDRNRLISLGEQVSDVED